MKKLVWIFGGTTFVMVVSFLIAGLMADEEFSTAETRTIKATPAEVWAYLINLTDLPKRRKEVKSVEMKGKNDKGLPVWIEHTDMDGSIEFEMLEKIKNEKLTVHMITSTIGMSGKWTYSLASSPLGCEVTITETSKITSLPLRAVLSIVGRNANIVKEFTLMEQALVPAK